MSKDRLAEWIKGLDAENISVLSRRLAGIIANHIGEDTKRKIELFVQFRKAPPLPRSEKIRIEFEEQTIAYPFLIALDKQIKFNDHLSSLIQQKITEDFATPHLFLEFGTPFSLSDEDPCGILLETAEKMGLSLTQNNVPKKYKIKLEIDFKSTNESSIVFSLSETCDEVEFHREFLCFDIIYDSDSDDF